MTSLEDIKNRVEQLAKKIDAPAHLLPSFGNSRDGYPNVEINTNGHLSYEIYERGNTIRLDYACDPDHLLFIIFRDVTYEMAHKMHIPGDLDPHKLKHARRQKQLALLTELNPDWTLRMIEENKSWDIVVPPGESMLDRAGYIRLLMGQGYLYDEAVAKADKRGLYQ